MIPFFLPTVQLTYFYIFSDWMDCAAECANLPECEYWTYVNAPIENRACYLKSGCPIELPDFNAYSGSKVWYFRSWSSKLRYRKLGKILHKSALLSPKFLIFIKLLFLHFKTVVEYNSFISEINLWLYFI